ncbi:MAG: DUF4422 domain-containing protein [Lachnospiraceae bacterium]|nr:DUF4422 domain-containing protein [Lachnospiraceae bacterium]
MDKRNPDIKIMIATHKAYQMPDDELYLPLHVGAEGKKDEQGNVLDLGYQKDNIGDHISDKNSRFCELTGLYWAWKNLDYDYLGLVHYRRYFSVRKKGKNLFQNILTYQEAKVLLRKHDIIVPKKRKYYIESLYSHYSHTHYAEHLDETRKIIYEKYPNYIETFDKVIQQRYGYMFNMMIMRKDLMDSYCQWLFDILFELESRMEVDGLSAFQERFCGRVAEIIFNVWLAYQLESGKVKKDDVLEIPFIHMEKIRWGRKILLFLRAKFVHKKYDRSF